MNVARYGNQGGDACDRAHFSAMAVDRPVIVGRRRILPNQEALEGDQSVLAGQFAFPLGAFQLGYILKDAGFAGNVDKLRSGNGPRKEQNSNKRCYSDKDAEGAGDPRRPAIDPQDGFAQLGQAADLHRQGRGEEGQRPPDVVFLVDFLAVAVGEGALQVIERNSMVPRHKPVMPGVPDLIRTGQCSHFVPALLILDQQNVQPARAVCSEF